MICYGKARACLKNHRNCIFSTPAVQEPHFVRSHFFAILFVENGLHLRPKSSESERIPRVFALFRSVFTQNLQHFSIFKHALGFLWKK